MTYTVTNLGKICEFKYGDSLQEARRNGGNVPVFGSNGIVGWHDKTVSGGPTIIIGRKGSIGEVHLSKVACWPIDTTYYVETTKVPSDLTWLYYMLSAMDLPKLNKSAAVPGLNRNDAYEQKLPIPPLAEQQRIADILSRADRLRRLRRFALEMSDGYLQAVFLEMFGDPVTTKPIKLGEVLRENPKNGLYLSSEFYGKGNPIIRINNFYNGMLNSSVGFKRVQASSRQVNEFSVQNGEVLVNRVNSLEYLGKCALVQGLTETTLFESNMMRVRVDESRITPLYLARYLSSQHAKQQVLQRARNAVNQASINQTDLKSIVIPLPPIGTQLEFGIIAGKYDRLRAQQREALRQAEHLFQALLQAAFRGEMTPQNSKGAPSTELLDGMGGNEDR